MGLLIACTFNFSKVYALTDGVISPRQNIDQVLSTEKHHLFRSGGTTQESIYDKTYRSITYPKGYKVSRIDKKDISTFGDLLGGNSRTLWTYNYTTY